MIDLRVRIAFSFQCFTTKEATDANRHLRYPDPSDREIRYFDVQRYAWSKTLLVPMIEAIEKRKIWRTNQEEFFTVETEHEGQKLFYTVFFVVGRAKKAQDDHDLWLFVSSAYEKSRAPAKMDRAIRFETVLRKAYFG